MLELDIDAELVVEEFVVVTGDELVVAVEGTLLLVTSEVDD